MTVQALDDAIEAAGGSAAVVVRDLRRWAEEEAPTVRRLDYVTAAEDSESARAVEREIAAGELGASACLVSACGFDVSDTAAGFTKLHSFPRAEWPVLFDEARAGIRRTSSERDTPRRLAALEALIEAVRAA